MNLQNRVARLETKAAVENAGVCRCFGSDKPDVRTYEGHAAADADERPPGACDECGGEIRLIKLVIVTSTEEVRAGVPSWTLNLGATGEPETSDAA